MPATPCRRWRRRSSRASRSCSRPSYASPSSRCRPELLGAASFLGRDTLRWFDQRSEPYRGFGHGNLDYGAFFGASTDRDGLYASKVYYETTPDQVTQLPPGLFQVVTTAQRFLPGLVPLFTTISAQRDMGGQRLTYLYPDALKLADLGPMLDALGMGERLPGIMQILGLVLGGRFELPPGAALIALGPEFLSLLTLGLSERPRELAALSRWMTAFTPDDDVWPGRFSILSVRAGVATPPRISLYLRPAEFEVSAQALQQLAA